MATSTPIGAVTAAFILSLIAGILTLAGDGMMLAFAATGTGYGMMGGYQGMMNGYGMMRGFLTGPWFYSLAWVGLAAGAVILVGAVMLYARPGSIHTSGVLILAFSVVSLLGMGGFFVGAILGVVGGALAITSKQNPVPH